MEIREKAQGAFARPCLVFFELANKKTDKVYSSCKEEASIGVCDNVVAGFLKVLGPYAPAYVEQMDNQIANPKNQPKNNQQPHHGVRF
jgi:hypothetical protein